MCGRSGRHVADARSSWCARGATGARARPQKAGPLTPLCADAAVFQDDNDVHEKTRLGLKRAALAIQLGLSRDHSTSGNIARGGCCSRVAAPRRGQWSRRRSRACKKFGRTKVSEKKRAKEACTARFTFSQRTCTTSVQSYTQSVALAESSKRVLSCAISFARFLGKRRAKSTLLARILHGFRFQC